MNPAAILWLVLLPGAQQSATLYQRELPPGPGEAIATVRATCARCNWAIAGREAVMLEVTIDGAYSQHLALLRGGTADYPILLGPLAEGAHRLELRRDAARSAPDAGAVTIDSVDVRIVRAGTTDYEWIARAPLVRARPGTVERFSDFPLVMYAERHTHGESGTDYRYQYTAIFTNEDGGTPTDRLMATWGRTTDIEFIYGLTSDATPREEIQAEGHRWIAFRGPRHGLHPVVWVATDNNMVADRGPADALLFAPAPDLIALDHVSREAVMDQQPWTYAITSAEMLREGRIDPEARAGSGRIPDPRRYATVEACGTLRDATLAFDIGVTRDGQLTWYASDRGEPGFRIARGGCFRGGAPLPPGTATSDITALRVRAYTRPPREGESLPPRGGRVTIDRVVRVFMLDEQFVPRDAPLAPWIGALDIQSGEARMVPLILLR